MEVVVNTDRGHIVIKDAGDLCTKLYLEGCKTHTHDFIEAWNRYEIAHALRKEAKEWDSKTA